jgi:hypothetical protein
MEEEWVKKLTSREYDAGIFFCRKTTFPLEKNTSHPAAGSAGGTISRLYPIVTTITGKLSGPNAVDHSASSE